MKDNVKEFLALRGALLSEKKQLLGRLEQIEAALADAGAVVAPVLKRRGRPPGATTTTATATATAAPVKRAKRAKRKAAASKTGKRVRNKVSLREMALKLTKGNPMTKEQIIDAVKKAGYVFNASDPIPSLNSVLYSKKQFKNKGGKFSPTK